MSCLTMRRPQTDPNQQQQQQQQPALAMAYEIPEKTPTDCPPNKRGVLGYENQFRTGKTLMWCKDDDGTAIRQHLGGTKLSYISVPAGMKVTLFTKPKFAGESRVFEAGEWDLHSLQDRFSDRAASIKIEGSPPDAATGATGQYYDHNRSGLGV